MFDDKQFNVIAKVDKCGRKIDKKDTELLQQTDRGIRQEV